MPANSSSATVDEDNAQVSRTVFVRELREAVWSALSVIDVLVEWAGSAVSVPPFPTGDASVLELERGGDSDGGHRLRVCLADAAGGTELVVTESGFGTEDAAALRSALDRSRSHWDERLDDLVLELEKQDSQ